MSSPKYLSFSCAGTKGVAYIGVIDALEDRYDKNFLQWRSTISGVAGCSSGTIAALIFALGINSKKRRELVRHMANTDIFMKQPDLAMFITHYGLEDSSVLKGMVRKILEMGGLSATSTLGDLRRLLRMQFVCAVTLLDEVKGVMLSSEHTPEVTVVDAICASCCIPFAYRPYEINGVKYIDGAMTCTLPNPFAIDDTLFVTVDGHDRHMPTKTWFEYIFAVIRCAEYNQTFETDLQTQRPKQLLTVHLDGKTSSFELNMTMEQIRDCTRAAYVCTCDHLQGFKLREVAGTVCLNVSKVLSRHRISIPDDELPP